MAGKPKRRIEKARAMGNHALADWIERREKAREEGTPLYKWEEMNPKPPENIDAPDEDEGRNPRVPAAHNLWQEDVKKNEGKGESEESEESEENIEEKELIPAFERELIERIREKKSILKNKARDSRTNDKELKTIYKMMKRLDAEEKRIIYRYDFKKFDEDCFHELQDRVETAPFHFEMFGLYQDSRRACVVCPRGHAKSTTARKYILHQILYQETQYTIIVGASEDMAAQNLRWVRDQLVDNAAITSVYGYLKNKDKWADTEFQTNTGIKVSAKGAGQKIRGANEKGRPDLIYMDDMEEDEQVSSKDRREKLRKWMTQAVMPALSRNGRIIITGTILHLDSLLKNISRNLIKDHIDWDVLWYQAITTTNGKEEALWPEHKPLDVLKRIRENDPETFAQEYQNNPASGGMGVFRREEYKYVTENDIKVDHDGKVYVKNRLVNTLVTTDFALSEKEGADYTVLMATGMDAESNLYVLEYERFRSSDPFEQMDMLFEMMLKWGADTAVMETVAFQKVFQRYLEIEMEKRGFHFYIHELTRHNMRKIFRIKGLKAPIRGGKIYWQHHHDEIEEELGQVTVTSLGTHDDVIDCLSDAWEVQVEMFEDNGGKSAAVNTVDWAIEKGLFPMASEVEEMALYD